MKLTLAQLNPIIGDIQGNADRLKEVVSNVSEQGSDLVIFSELYLCGYPPKDLLEYPSFLDRVDDGVQEIIQFSVDYPDIGILFGLPRRTKQIYGKGLTNSVVLVCGGKEIAQIDKCLLPTYDIFDEGRYFDAASEVNPVTFKGENLGISICEDCWNDERFWPQRLYSFNPVEQLAEKSATILINLSAAPFALGRDEVRFQLSQNHACRYNLPFIMVNPTGAQDELVYDGTSVAINRKGELILSLQPFESEVKTVDLNANLPKKDFVPMEPVASIYQALVLGIKDYVRKCGFKNVLVGLSGGIDSAVTCALAVAALGADKVIGVTMPSVFSSEGSIKDSKELAQNLGIAIEQIPILEIHHQYLQELQPQFNGKDQDNTEENIQARIRGNLLMALSNKFSSLVLATGNKSELAMGYCTLYGDMSGGLAVLSDVPKTMVYQLADFINREKEIIPTEIIAKEPSAELRLDQRDQDSLPPYEILDEILELYVEKKKSAAEIMAAGFDKETTKSVIATVDRSEYKRRQAAPGLRVTCKAFGLGRRMPIAADYNYDGMNSS